MKLPFPPLFWIRSVIATALLIGPLVHAEDEPPPVDPKAIEILERATQHLSAASCFSFSAEIWEDFFGDGGAKLQFTRIVDAKVRRPDRAQLDIRTTVPRRSVFYDGKSVTVLDRMKGFFGTQAVPPTIDEAIAAMEENHGISLPIDDLLLSKPFGGAAAKALTGQYFGVEPVHGAVCHHLAFQNEGIDWQVWIDAGVVPIFRKLVITDKFADGEPQLIAILSEWDFETELPDFVFAFNAPPNAVQVELQKATDNPSDENKPE